MLVACGATVRKRARGDPDPYFQPLNTDVYNGHRAVTAVVADGHLIHDVWGADPSTGAITRLGELFPPVYCASAFWNDDGNSAIRFYRIDAGGTPVKEGTTPVSATNAFDVRLAPLGVSGVIQSVRDDDGENEVELTVYEAARKSDNTVAADLVVRHSAEATMSGPPRARRPAVSCHFTTRYLRWVTSGASTTRTGSRLTSAPAMLSKSRVPSPSTTGTTLSCSSSTRPAARYCWMTFAPPPSETSLPAAASSGLRERRLDAGGDERERRSALLLERLTLVVCEHEDRRAERRIVPPPALPGVVSPGPRSAAEHVAAHHGRADVLERLLDDLGTGVDLAALEPVRLAPGRELERPLV